MVNQNDCSNLRKLKMDTHNKNCLYIHWTLQFAVYWPAFHMKRARGHVSKPRKTHSFPQRADGFAFKDFANDPSLKAVVNSPTFAWLIPELLIKVTVIKTSTIHNFTSRHILTPRKLWGTTIASHLTLNLEWD